MLHQIGRPGAKHEGYATFNASFAIAIAGYEVSALSLVT